ncbi:MAG: hypothetical protein AAEI92_09110 [Arenicellales bacterium]
MIVVRLMFIALVTALLALPVAIAGGPPQGEDAAAWCEANSDECATWCESNPEAEICQEPECD